MNVLRKVSLLMINVFIENPSYKILISLGILMTIFFIQNRVKPYQEKFFNALEQREMAASVSFLCAGILLMQEQGVDWITYIVVALAVIMNVMFFAFWL